MATITTLSTTDDGATSMGIINTNFANLNADISSLNSGKMDIATYDASGIAEQLVGETATQTLTNKTLNVANNTITNKYIARAYLDTANQAIGAVTFSKVAVNAETFDPNNDFDITTNYQYVAPVSGYYAVNGAVQITMTAQDDAFCSIYKNGVENSRGSRCVSDTNFVNSSQVTDIVYLTAGDTVELYAWAGTGGNIIYGSAKTYISIMLISK